MNSKKKSFSKFIPYILFVITCVIIYFTQRAVPFMQDDVWYSTKLFSDEPVKTIGDVIKAQSWHYQNWGGRSMAHGILQLLLPLGESFCDVANLLTMVILSLAVILVSVNMSKNYRIDTQTSNPENKGLTAGTVFLYLTAVIGMLHGLNADWRMSMYWQSGSANYLYITVFIVLFIYPYIRELTKETLKPLKGITLWIVPLGILAGWSNENMGPTVWLLSVFAIIYSWKKKKPVKTWMFLGSAFSLAGSALCILAPGNFVRKNEAVVGETLFIKFFNRIYSEGTAFASYLFPAFLTVLSLAIILYGILKVKPDIKTMTVISMAVVSFGAMILSPHYPARASFGTMVFLIIAAVSMIMGIINAAKNMKWWMIGFMTFIYVRGLYFLIEFIGIAKGWIA